MIGEICNAWLTLLAWRRRRWPTKGERRRELERLEAIRAERAETLAFLNGVAVAWNDTRMGTAGKRQPAARYGGEIVAGRPGVEPRLPGLEAGVLPVGRAPREKP